jgi:vitamin B12 transporter
VTTREPGDRPARVALAVVQELAKARNLRLSDEHCAAGAASDRVTGAGRPFGRARRPFARTLPPMSLKTRRSYEMIKTYTPATASLLAVVAASSAFGQAAPDPTAVSPVVVTATRIPTPKIDVANSITVITAQDIALKQQQTLPDVLADVPGLNVVQAGGPGGFTSVFLRGTNANHVKVIVDGIDVSDPSSSNGAFDFGQFLTPEIDRVEVLRGPQSGLYGSDAIGGVINVITKSGNGPPHLDVGLEGGTFDTFNQNAVVSGSTGALHYVATVEHFRSGGTPVTPLDLLAPGEQRNDDVYDNFTASTKLGYDVTSNFDLGLVARYTDSHLRFTGDDDILYGYPDSIQSTSHDQQFYGRASGHLSLLDGRFEQTLGLAYSNLQSSDFTPNYGFSLFYGNRVKVDWQGDIKLANTETLVLGAEHQRDEISQPISAGTSIDSGYIELQSNPFRNFNDTISARYDSNSRFGGQATYRIAPTYFIDATGTKLSLSVGSGFKAPTLSEMFQNYPSFGFFGNPNLSPEKSVGVDVGFEQHLLDERLQFGATYFYNHITDLIDDNATFTSYINIGKAHTDGVESFVLIKPVSTVSFRVDYTYTEADDDILHEQLLRRPHNKWNFDARWQATSKLSLDADVISVGSRVDGNRDFSIPRLEAPGYTTVSLAANYDVTSHLTFYGRITNLADEHYEDPDGFLRPGRGFFIGVKAKL